MCKIIIMLSLLSKRRVSQCSPCGGNHAHLIVFLLFQLGLMASYAVWAISQSFSMFLLFRVISGICKGNVSLCTAIVADSPSPNVRNRGMVGTGRVHALTRLTSDM